MRWIVYFILAYVSLGIQAGLAGPFLRVHGAPPNVVLLAAIFVAVNARREPALLGCFLLGLMQDLLTSQALGLYAMSYGLVAMFVISTQEFVYRDHPLTHFSLALVGGLMTAGVLFVHGWIRGPFESPVALLTSAAYTAVIAVPVLGLLQMVRKAFAFQPSRLRHRL